MGDLLDRLDRDYEEYYSASERIIDDKEFRLISARLRAAEAWAEALDSMRDVSFPEDRALEKRWRAAKKACEEPS